MLGASADTDTIFSSFLWPFALFSIGIAIAVAVDILAISSGANLGSILAIMKHLCDACSGLRDGGRMSSIFSNMRVLESISDPVYGDNSISYLLKSSEGSLAAKPCHFCAVVLRSLKHHEYIGTAKENAHLPTGPVHLNLVERKDHDLVIRASSNTFLGERIQLSLDAG